MYESFVEHIVYKCRNQQIWKTEDTLRSYLKIYDLAPKRSLKKMPLHAEIKKNIWIWFVIFKLYTVLVALNKPLFLQIYLLSLRNRHSVVGIATGYGLDDRGVGVQVPVGPRIFLSSTSSRPALGSTEPPIRWVPGALSPRVKRPGREADQ
jgi:hypothetical protein